MDVSLDALNDTIKDETNDNDDVEFVRLVINERQSTGVKNEDLGSWCPKPEEYFETKYHTLENLNPSTEYNNSEYSVHVKCEYEEILDDLAELQPLNMNNVVPVPNVQINDDIFALDDQIRKNIIYCRNLAAEAEAILMEKSNLQRELEGVDERIISLYDGPTEKKLMQTHKKNESCTKSWTPHKRSTYQYRFGIPYFKSVDRFPATCNEDLKAIVDNNEIMFFRFLPCNRKLVLARDLYKIETAILNQLKRKRLEHLESLLLQVSGTDDDSDNCQQKYNLTGAIDCVESVDNRKFIF